jgi:hypothetical protein
VRELAPLRVVQAGVSWPAAHGCAPIA